MSLVLMTGASGDVARGVLPFLEKDFSLRLLSLDGPAHDARFVQADILDWSALGRAMEGCDAVLHLAVASGHSGTFEDDAFNDQRFQVNVQGTYHVFECARRAGVKRVVQVSSLMAVWGYGRDSLIAGDAPPRPVGTYGLTKALGEKIAEHYARTMSLEVIVLRIAAPLNLGAPDVCAKPVRPQQVPFPDLAQAFRKALTVPLDGFHVVTIVGQISCGLWDLEPARQILGYEPQVCLDNLGLTFADPFDVPPI